MITQKMKQFKIIFKKLLTNVKEQCNILSVKKITNKTISEGEQIMNKYFVIATKWDNAKRKQVQYIAGTFDDIINAKLFKDAYNEYYRSDARIEDTTMLLNK